MAEFNLISHEAEVLRALENAKQKALEEIGLTAERYAKAECPVGTPESTGIPHYHGGTLRNSITHTVQGHTAYIGTDIKYGKYVNNGTRYMRARPFLTNAATKHGKEYKEIMEKEMKHA